MPRPPLIAAAELAAAVVASHTPAGGAAGGVPPVILDVRWTLAGPDPDGYLAGHVPGARYVDLDRDLAGPAGPGGRHPLPEPALLQQVWRSAGIDDGTAVVVYDGGPGLAAARAWWLLRWSGLNDVTVLDGGWPAWRQDPARPVERGGRAGPARVGTVLGRPGSMPVVGMDGVGTEQVGSGAGAHDDAGRRVLLDARARPRFRGEVEPLDPVAGHIPGAVNLPASELLAADGRYRSAAEIAALFATAGVGPGYTGPPPAASCGSGVTACQLVFAGELVGIELALFPGSYSQWCAAGRPVATGP